MRVFDEIHSENLDSRQLQLTLLASMTIAVLATGVALLMYPAIFSQEIMFSGRTLQLVFYGFCCLSVLIVGYLLDRQLTIRQLKQQLQDEQKRNIELDLQDGVDLLNTISGLGSFRERLSREYVQIASELSTLSAVVVQLCLSEIVSRKGEDSVVFGDAAQAICRRLRVADSIYVLYPGVYGIILPHLDTPSARRFITGLEVGLRDAAGVSSRFTSEVRMFNYPEHAESVRQLEQAVCSLLPQGVSELATPRGS